MDRFVIRTPRHIAPRKERTPDKELVQTTLPSLKRVVVVEDLLRAKSLLEIQDQKSEVLIEELEKLLRSEKIPSKTVLAETGLGLLLNQLRKNAEPRVSDLASQLYRLWRSFFKNQLERPQIEVRHGRKTEQLRLSARQMFSRVFSDAQDASKLAEATERCLFERSSCKTESEYRKLCRKLIFSLQNNSALKQLVISKNLSPNEFINQVKPSTIS